MILTCGASSLTFPNSTLISLPSTLSQSIQDEIHRSIANIAYSCNIPENSSISVPVQYRVRTAQNSYSNWIDVINLNAEPIQVCSCQVSLEGNNHSKIRAEIEQSGVSLQNAFSIVDVDADSSDSINSLDFGSVAVGGVSLKCVKLVNEGAISLLMHIDAPAGISPVVILEGSDQLCVRD